MRGSLFSGVGGEMKLEVVKAEVLDSDEAETKRIDKTSNTPLLTWGLVGPHRT
jgi:hypothetical protein